MRTLLWATEMALPRLLGGRSQLFGDVAASPAAASILSTMVGQLGLHAPLNQQHALQLPVVSGQGYLSSVDLAKISCTSITRLTTGKVDDGA
jgi:hypothetical protein